MADHPLSLAEYPAHIGPGAVARALPRFDGTGEWYAAYEAATAADGVDGWLVSWHTFTESWDSWEVHPDGHEIVVCIAGEITLVQDVDGVMSTAVLTAGQWALNRPGTWHTADVAPGATCTCLFITAGQGTTGRPRS